MSLLLLTPNNDGHEIVGLLLLIPNDIPLVLLELLLVLNNEPLLLDKMPFLLFPFELPNRAYWLESFKLSQNKDIFNIIKFYEIIYNELIII